VVCGLAALGSVRAADLALGRHLSAECVACHPPDNRPKGIPAIIGWPQDQFIAVLRSYKAKERDNPVMQSVAASLSDEQMAALAAYFATLKPGG
jgi:cytochrome c